MYGRASVHVVEGSRSRTLVGEGSASVFMVTETYHSINPPRIKESAGKSVRIVYPGGSFILRDLE